MIEFVVKYILDENFINKLFLITAVASPILGVFVGFIMDKFKKTNRLNFTVMGLAIGLLGTMNLFLWKLYDRFTEYFGLASVKNLLFNLAFFLVLGAIIGVIFSLLWRYLNRQKINETK
ncbi:hypothetical protein KKB18_08490 [bacterium]|nr:hypothetical protein [bacterium]